MHLPPHVGPWDPTFQGMPPSPRQKIYDYLLSDRNVTYIKADKSFQSKYETTLFRVSKQISKESLEFFYAKNAFVALKTCLNNLFLVVCRRAIPVITGDNIENTVAWNRLPLEIQIGARSTDGSPNGWENTSAVIAGRHLPNFVNMINTEHSTLRNMKLESQLTLTYRGEPGADPATEVLLVDGVKGIRKIPGRSGMKIEIVGLGDEKRKKVQEATGLPPRTNKEIVELGIKTKDQGNAYYKEKDYTSALCEYVIAMGAIMNIAGEIMQAGGETFEAFLKLLINIHTNESLIATQQEDHKLAIDKAEKAFQYTINRPGGDTSTPAQKAKLLFRLGSAYADDGQYENAVIYFEEACVLLPGNVGMNNKLKIVEALRDEI